MTVVRGTCLPNDDEDEEDSGNDKEEEEDEDEEDSTTSDTDVEFGMPWPEPSADERRLGRRRLRAECEQLEGRRCESDTADRRRGRSRNLSENVTLWTVGACAVAARRIRALVAQEACKHPTIQLTN